MRNKGLTMTIVFEAESANYGEGLGNISVLKKMTRGDGHTYTYISRQALRYSMIDQLGWTDTPLQKSGSSDKGVVQFAPSANIIEHPEIDLFGYMKTEAQKGALTRSAVVRLSNAVSLEPYSSDTDFLTNMGLAKRLGQDNSITQREIHHSYYSYTITIDLDRVGVDANTPDAELPVDQRAARVCAFLEVVRNLYRDIGARRENLAPVFIIGGVYDRKNPYFENRVHIKSNQIAVSDLCEIVKDDTDLMENTVCGILGGSFANAREIENKLSEVGVRPVTVGEFFKRMEERVTAVYAG